MAKVRGAAAVRSTLRRMPKAIREEAIKEVRASTKRMHSQVMAMLATSSSYAAFWHGQPGMQNITGTARRAYRYSVSQTQMKGRVGLLSPAAERSAFYLRFFFYGSVHQPARPVHDDAFEEERDVFIQNQGRALERVLRMLP